MNNYTTISEYVKSRNGIKEKINAIDTIIDGLINKAAESIDQSGYEEYRMDDGQMSVRAIYRSIGDITKDINSLNKLKTVLINSLNGRVSVFRGGSGLNIM